MAAILHTIFACVFFLSVNMHIKSFFSFVFNGHFFTLLSLYSVLAL